MPSTIELAPPSTFPKGASAYPCLPASLTSVGSLLVGVSVPVPVAGRADLVAVARHIAALLSGPRLLRRTYADGGHARIGQAAQIGRQDYLSWPARPSRTAAALASPRRGGPRASAGSPRRGGRPSSRRETAAPLCPRFPAPARPVRAPLLHARSGWGVLPRRGTRPPRQPPGAALAQTASDDRRRRPSAQAQPCSYRDCRAPPRAVRPARSIVPLLIRRSRGRARSPV